MQNNIIKKQLNRMKVLMGTSTITEAQKKAQDPVEYSTMGPDGNYYGIVREGAKYYIKSAKPDVKGKLIKEHLDYIGGFLQRKQNEYNSFASAKRNLEGKLYSLDEAIKANATLVECNTDKSKSKRIIIEAKGEIRSDIKRQLEIMNNSQVLDEQRAGYKSANALIVENDTSFCAGSTECDGEAFDEKGNPKCKGGKLYKNPTNKGGNAISTQIKEAEDDEDVISDDDEAQVTNAEEGSAIGDNGEKVEDDAEMDLGDGIADAEEAGDINDEDDEMSDADDEEDILSPDDTEEDEEFGDDELEDDFSDDTRTIYVSKKDLPEKLSFEIVFTDDEDGEAEQFEDDDLYGDDMEGDDMEGDDTFDADDNMDEEEGEENADAFSDADTEDFSDADGADVDLEDEDDEDDNDGNVEESFRRKGRKINEARMLKTLDKMLNEENYFGKHPKYLAKPFTTPKAHAEFQNTYDWNDESVDNEDEPFTDNQRYKYFSKRPEPIENSLGLAESRVRSKKGKSRF